jgi:hypothetical protein
MSPEIRHCPLTVFCSLFGAFADAMRAMNTTPRPIRFLLPEDIPALMQRAMEEWSYATR